LATQLVKLRRSATQGAVPTTGQLELGELALNTYDGTVYMKKSVGGTESIVQVGLDLTTNSTTTTSTSEVVIASFSTSVFRTNKHVIQVTDTVSNEYHSVEMLVVHDGSDAYRTEYGELHTGTSALATFDVDISGGNVRLLATPASTNSTTFKVVTQNTKI
jgi:hypothetical protein